MNIFLKFLKWFIAISFFIVGVYCLRLVTDTGNIQPIIVTIFCFGIVFWMSKTTYEAPKNIMLGSVGVLVGSGLLAKYFTADLIFFLTNADIGFYPAWEVTAFAAGLPVMSWLFIKDK